MSSTQLFGSPPGPGLKLSPGQVPAFTAEDMTSYLQSAPSCSLGPTLSGEPPTVELLEFAPSKELRERLNLGIVPADDALICHVVLRGPFLLRGISLPPGHPGGPAFSNTVEEFYDARTGHLVVVGLGSHRRPGDQAG